MGRTEIAISLLSEDHASEDEQDNPPVLTVPWSKASHRRHRHVIAPEDASRTQVVPIRSDTRTKLVAAIARGRQWQSEIEAGTVTIDGIAAREACSNRHVNMTISTSSVREPGHLVLARPADRRVEQAGDADTVGQPTFDAP